MGSSFIHLIRTDSNEFSGWETHVNPWLIHFNVWQNPLQYCKVISLQLIKKNKKKKKQEKKIDFLSLVPIHGEMVVCYVE